MFHRQFPELLISTTLLRKTYKRANIKYKSILRVKRHISFEEGHYRELFMEMYSKVEKVQTEQLLIIFLDEAIFSFSTFASRTWSSVNDNIVVPEEATRVKTQALLAAISAEKGVEHFLIHDRSISTPEFLDFLEQLSELNSGKPIALFLDNLSVHRTNVAATAMRRLLIQPIFNVPYSPQFNGIEAMFSVLKNNYKKLLLERIVNHKTYEVRDLIQRSIKMIDIEVVRSCVKFGMDEISKLKIKLG